MGNGVLGFQLAEWNGAGDGIRTRDIDLGKVALYQLSYSRLAGILILYGFCPAVKLEHFRVNLF